MRVTKELRQLVATEGASGLIKICELESFRLTEKLKVTSVDNFKKIQGNIEALEFLIKFKAL